MTGTPDDPVVAMTPLASLAFLRTPIISRLIPLVLSTLANRPTLAGAGLSLPVAVCTQLAGAVLPRFRLLVRHLVIDLAVVQVLLLVPCPALATPWVILLLPECYRRPSPLKLVPLLGSAFLHVSATVRVIVPCIVVEN